MCSTPVPPPPWHVLSWDRLTGHGVNFPKLSLYVCPTLSWLSYSPSSQVPWNVAALSHSESSEVTTSWQKIAFVCQPGHSVQYAPLHHANEVNVTILNSQLDTLWSRNSFSHFHINPFTMKANNRKVYWTFKSSIYFTRATQNDPIYNRESKGNEDGRSIWLPFRI